MNKAFASANDLAEQTARLFPLADGVFGYLSTFDPNVGVITGEEGSLVIDTRATPSLARDLMADLERSGSAPIRFVFLTHYHAVRVLGAAAYGAPVIAAADTGTMIEDYGQLDYEVEVARFPRLFKGVEEIPGLTRPTITFRDEMVLRLGGRQVHLRRAGRGHSGGDAYAWLPDQRILFSGDLVERRCTPYTGEAFLSEWLVRLDELAALGPKTLVPGRGSALVGRADCLEAIAETKEFLVDLIRAVRPIVDDGVGFRDGYQRTIEALAPKYGNWAIFEHAMPFNYCRARDELNGIAIPVPWTTARDQAVWAKLHG